MTHYPFDELDSFTAQLLIFPFPLDACTDETWEAAIETWWQNRSDRSRISDVFTHVRQCASLANLSANYMFEVDLQEAERLLTLLFERYPPFSSDRPTPVIADARLRPGWNYVQDFRLFARDVREAIDKLMRIWKPYCDVAADKVSQKEGPTQTVASHQDSPEVDWEVVAMGKLFLKENRPASMTALHKLLKVDGYPRSRQSLYELPRVLAAAEAAGIYHPSPKKTAPRVKGSKDKDGSIEGYRLDDEGAA